MNCICQTINHFNIMKILHISKYYFPYIGGIENTCKQLSEYTKFETAVICFNEARNDIIETINGIKVYRVGSWVNVSRQALSLSYFPMLRRAIREFSPDIIHFHWANPFPAAVLLTVIPKDVKLLIHWHMDVIKQKKIYPFVKPIEYALLKRADRIVVTSPIYRDNSRPLQPFLSKIDVVPSAIDVSNLTIKEGDEERICAIKKQYDGKDIVFFVGRHIQYKGLPHLIEAEKKVRSNCVFVIAGCGPLTEELKAKCKSNRVYFIGKVSDNDLRCYLYAAKVFAFPSITKNEAFGVALAEAMYCNTPAVTFTIKGSGVNWVNLNGVTGIEVPQGKNQDLLYAQALDRLLTDKELQIRYAEAAHKRVAENFLIKHMVEAMEKVYKELEVCRGR